VTWTQLTCEGLAPLFKGRPCENYSSPPPECLLLKESAITRLCETGRCVFAMVGFVQEKLAARFDHLDGREEIDLKKLWKRLSKVAWNNSSNPAKWLFYVKKVIHSTTVKALAKQRLMPEEKNCGTCAHLPKGKPRECQMKGDIKRARDRACEDYQFLPMTIAVGSENDTDELGSETGAKFVPEATERSEEAQQSVDARMAVESLLVALAERVEKEKSGTRRRAKATRQYELVVNLSHLAANEDYSDISEEKVLKIVAKQMGVCPRTVRRDLAETRLFLKIRFPGQGG
jgi:hypothetical protein